MLQALSREDTASAGTGCEGCGNPEDALGQWSEVGMVAKDAMHFRSPGQELRLAVTCVFLQTGCQVGMTDEIRDSSLPDWRD